MKMNSIIQKDLKSVFVEFRDEIYRPVLTPVTAHHAGRFPTSFKYEGVSELKPGTSVRVLPNPRQGVANVFTEARYLEIWSRE